MADFVPVAKTAELQPGQMKRAMVNRQRVLLAHVEGAFFAIKDECGHQKAPLSKGKLEAEVAECPLHFACFNAAESGLGGFSATQLDWFEATVDGEFDLVLLADVAYEERHFEPLLRHLDCCLAPGGTALLGDPYRRVADTFVDMLESKFAVNTTHTDTFFAGRRVPLRLVHLS